MPGGPRCRRPTVDDGGSTGGPWLAIAASCWRPIAGGGRGCPGSSGRVAYPAQHHVPLSGRVSAGSRQGGSWYRGDGASKA